MRKLRLICVLLNTGKLSIVDVMLDDEANDHPRSWRTMVEEANRCFDNVIVVTTRIDVNAIIDMFMEDGQILSSDVQLFKEG